MMIRLIRCCCLLLLTSLNVCAQWKPVWTELPSLPDKEGFAGMFAGVSNGNLFCMGGANFPGKRPWEGGAKKWYDNMYMLRDKKWILLPDKLYAPVAYGVSVSYNNKIIIAGGSSEKFHAAKVVAYTWSNNAFLVENYPELPLPLANMAGVLVGNVLMVAGGNSVPAGPALKKCFGLDLTAVKNGWFELPVWPGPARIAPACAAYKGTFYLFSGETSGLSAAQEKYRLILLDAYCFALVKISGAWGGEWKTLSPIPKGCTAAGMPLPVFNNGSVLLWGGVDAVTSAYNDPATHPGTMREVLMYDTHTDTWQYTGKKEDIASRVTLPVVYWNGAWVFISGEVKPGIRTNTVYAVH